MENKPEGLIRKGRRKRRRYSAEINTPTLGRDGEGEENRKMERTE
jgi:hypothetical protein